MFATALAAKMCDYSTASGRNEKHNYTCRHLLHLRRQGSSYADMHPGHLVSFYPLQSRLGALVAKDDERATELVERKPSTSHDCTYF